MHRLISDIAARLSQVFCLDLRSLALARMGLGLLILGGLIERSFDFRIFFTEDGTWPIAAAMADTRHAPGLWSLHWLNGSFGWQAGLCALELAAGLGVLLGWRTRICTVLAWVLVLSAENRNGLIVGGGPILLRLLLFWGMWLPLGARWSLDARRRPLPVDAPHLVLSAATVAWLVQMVVMYLFNAAYKTGPAWHARGDAIWITLSSEIYASSVGRALLAWPELLRLMTRGVWWFEALGPLLLFIPWKTVWWRMIAILMFVGFHGGLAATMNLGSFPYACIVGWLAFLPSQVWDGFRSPDSGLVRARWPANLALAAGLVLVLCWNFKRWHPWLEPRWLRTAGYLLRLDQRWNLFSPSPADTEGWFVVVGTNAGGRETNLITGESPVDWRRPRDLGEVFPTTAWRKFGSAIRARGREQRARSYAEWLAREWLQANPGNAPFTRLEVYYLSESIYRRGAVPDNYLIYENPPSELGKPAMPETDKGPVSETAE